MFADNETETFQEWRRRVNALPPGVEIKVPERFIVPHIEHSKPEEAGWSRARLAAALSASKQEDSVLSNVGLCILMRTA